MDRLLIPMIIDGTVAIDTAIDQLISVWSDGVAVRPFIRELIVLDHVLQEDQIPLRPIQTPELRLVV